MGLIRFLLALSVVFAHSEPIFHIDFMGGPMAVQCFYMISGFYMAMILNEKYTGKNGSYKLFITNRFLRLYPVYWTVLLLAVMFSFLLFFTSGGKNAGQLVSWFSYLPAMSPASVIFLSFTNLFLFFQDWVMFLGLNPADGSLFFTPDFRQSSPMLYTFLLIPQAWTIGIELLFYVVAPFIVKKGMRILIVLIVLSLFVRLLLWLGGLRHDPWSYRFLPSEFVFFMLGSLSYKLYRRYPIAVNSRVLKAWFGGLILLIVSYSRLPIPGLNLLFFAFFFCSLPVIFNFTRNWKLDAAIGELSYPIYISHMLVIAVLNRLHVVSGSTRNNILIVISCVLVAMALNFLVAQRIEKVRRRRLARQG